MNPSRTAQEKKTVELMIRLYCRHKEGNRTLCRECSDLLAYSLRRLDKCKFSNNKPTCRRCPVHCYIRAVMRWTGPRMLLYHPMAAVRHLLREYLGT